LKHAALPSRLDAPRVELVVRCDGLHPPVAHIDLSGGYL
jgi:hypothetical protein